MDDDTDHEYLMELLEKYLWVDETGYIVQILYDMGYDCCAKLIDGSKVTTIRDICCEYAKRGKINAFKRMYELGIDLETPIVDGKTPAYIICRYADGDKECIPALEYCSVKSMETLSNEGLAAVHMVVWHDDEPHLINYMIKRGVNMNLTYAFHQEGAFHAPLFNWHSIAGFEAAFDLVALERYDEAIELLEKIFDYGEIQCKHCSNYSQIESPVLNKIDLTLFHGELKPSDYLWKITRPEFDPLHKYERFQRLLERYKEYS